MARYKEKMILSMLLSLNIDIHVQPDYAYTKLVVQLCHDIIIMTCCRISTSLWQKHIKIVVVSYPIRNCLELCDSTLKNFEYLNRLVTFIVSMDVAMVFCGDYYNKWV